MDQSTLDLLSKVAIPLVTFLGGVLVTLAVKRTDRKRDKLREHASGLLKITNDWYNQIHAIVVNGSVDGESPETTRQAFFYVQNRLLLPELIVHLDYIKRVDPSSALIAPTEAFLAEVTNYKPAPRGRAVATANQTYFCYLIPAVSEQMDKARHRDNLLLLRRLDERVQELARASAVALASEP